MTTATEIPHIWDGHSMWRHKSPLADGLYRIRIPAHTSAWSTGITTWRMDEPAAATGLVKVLTAAGWAAHAVKVWTGAMWRQSPLRRWTGASWT